MAWFMKIRKYVDLAIGIFLGLVLLVMAILIVISVTSRYTGGGMAWVEELVRVGVVWTTFLGSYVAIAKKREIRVDLLLERLPAGVQTVLRIVSDALVLFFLAFFIKLSFEYSAQFSCYNLPMTGISRGFVFSVFPIGSSLMGIHYLLSFIERLRNAFSKDKNRHHAAETTETKST